MYFDTFFLQKHLVKFCIITPLQTHEDKHDRYVHHVLHSTEFCPVICRTATLICLLFNHCKILKFVKSLQCKNIGSNTKFQQST